MLSTPVAFSHGTIRTVPHATPYHYELTRVDVSRLFVREHSSDTEYTAQSRSTAVQPDDRNDDLGIAEAHSVHEALTQLHSAGNQVRLRFLEVLQMLRENSLFVELGYSSFAQYCDREFGLPRSTAMEYVRVARALDRLPRLRVLFGEGSLSWQQVRSITRAATVQTETSWIELAVAEPVRKLEAEVREAVRTGRDAPREKRNGLPNLLVRLSIDLTLEEKERLRAALMVVSEAMENEADSKARDGGVDAGDGAMPAGRQRPVLIRWADGILSGAIPASPASPANGAGGAQAALRPAPAQTIVYHACPECRTATLQLEDGPVSVSEQRIEELAPSSNVLVIRSEEELPVKCVSVDRRDTPNSASLARKVVQRDGARCANPGCGNRLRLHAHHIVFRSAGGPTCLANEIGVCDQCHAMIHAGLLEVSGSPYTDLTWRPRPVSPAAKLRDARAVSARAREIGALLPPAHSAESRRGDTPSPVDEPAESAESRRGDTSSPVDEPAESAESRRGDTSSPVDEPAESAESRRGDTPSPVDEPAESAESRRGDTPSPLDEPAESAESRRGDTPSPLDEPAESAESRRGDTHAGWRELAGAQVSRRGDTDVRVRELADALVLLGLSRAEGRRLVEIALEALAGQAQTDEAILREALRNRWNDAR